MIETSSLCCVMDCKRMCIAYLYPLFPVHQYFIPFYSRWMGIDLCTYSYDIWPSNFILQAIVVKHLARIPLLPPKKAQFCTCTLSHNDIKLVLCEKMAEKVIYYLTVPTSYSISAVIDPHNKITPNYTLSTSALLDC